jgi:hypothetical protein
MRVLILVFLLAACTHPAPPVAPASSPPRNEAIVYARNNSLAPACIPVRTGEPKKPDTALCETGHVVLYCYAGEGQGSECLAIADFRAKPPQPEVKKPDEKPADTKKLDDKPKDAAKSETKK